MLTFDRGQAAHRRARWHRCLKSRKAGVGVEFLTTGSDGKVARWSDRLVVTEATRPEVLEFEFVTDGRRQGKPDRPPWQATAVHRYVVAPEAGGCKVTYTEDLTRLHSAPWMLRTPGVSRIVCSG